MKNYIQKVVGFQTNSVNSQNFFISSNDITYSMPVRDKNMRELKNEFEDFLNSGYRNYSSYINNRIEKNKSEKSQINKEVLKISETTTEIDVLTTELDKIEDEMKYTYNKLRCTPKRFED